MTVATRREGPPIVEVLRDSIRQRLLPPGAPLIQAAIAEALGVSRIPVREALQFLASEGLVAFTDEGTRVTALEPAEVHELWSLRALIEAALADGIVGNANEPDRRLLGGLVDGMDAAEDGDSWSDLNYGFHLELFRIAGMPHHAASAARVLTLIEPYSRVAVARLEGRGAAQAEHREMLAALAVRDARRLAEVLARHSTRARDLLVGYAEQQAGVPPLRAETSAAARAFVARLGA